MKTAELGYSLADAHRLLRRWSRHRISLFWTRGAGLAARVNAHLIVGVQAQRRDRPHECFWYAD